MLKWAIYAAVPFLGAVAGKATTVLSFSGASTGGTILASGTGSSQNVTTFSGIPFDTLVVFGAPSDNGVYTLSSASESFNAITDTLNITAAVPGLAGLTVATNIATIQLAGGLTATTNGSESSVNLNLPSNVTSISVSAALLADLGLTGATASLNGLGDVGQGNPNGSGTYQSISSTLGVNLASASATPEPGSGWLLAMGVPVIGFWRMRKLACARTTGSSLSR